VTIFVTEVCTIKQGSLYHQGVRFRGFYLPIKKLTGTRFTGPSFKVLNFAKGIGRSSLSFPKASQRMPVLIVIL